MVKGLRIVDLLLALVRRRWDWLVLLGPRFNGRGTPPNPYSLLAEPWTAPSNPGPLRLGQRAFSISVVNSFKGNFVWQLHLYSRLNSKLHRAAALAVRRQLLSA